MPAHFRGLMHAFIGVEETRIPTLLSSGMLMYLSVTMRKMGDPVSLPAVGIAIPHHSAPQELAAARQGTERSTLPNPDLTKRIFI